MKQTTIVRIASGGEFDKWMGPAVRGFEGYFDNPFPLEGIRRFRKHFYARLKMDATYRARVVALWGQRLGCPHREKPCSCDVIKEYLDTTNGAPVVVTLPKAKRHAG